MTGPNVKRKGKEPWFDDPLNPDDSDYPQVRRFRQPIKNEPPTPAPDLVDKQGIQKAEEVRQNVEPFGPCQIIEIIGHSEHTFEDAALNAISRAEGLGWTVRAVDVVGQTMKCHETGWDFRVDAKLAVDK